MWVWWWERLKVGGEGDERGWDGWMASLTRLTWVWVDSWSCWWTGRPGMLWFMWSQRVGQDWATELNFFETKIFKWHSDWPPVSQKRNNLEFLCFLWQHIYLHDGCVLSSYSHVPLFANQWTVAHQAPLFMEFSGKNTGMSRHAPLQGFLPTQRLNLGLLHCRQILYHRSHQGSPL